MQGLSLQTGGCWDRSLVGSSCTLSHCESRVSDSWNVSANRPYAAYVQLSPKAVALKRYVEATIIWAVWSWAFRFFLLLTDWVEISGADYRQITKQTAGAWRTGGSFRSLWPPLKRRLTGRSFFYVCTRRYFPKASAYIALSTEETMCEKKNRC